MAWKTRACYCYIHYSNRIKRFAKPMRLLLRIKRFAISVHKTFAFTNVTAGFSRIWASPARQHYFFHFWRLVQTLERGPTVESPWSSSIPPWSSSIGKGRVAPPPSNCYFGVEKRAADEALIPITKAKIF